MRQIRRAGPDANGIRARTNRLIAISKQLVLHWGKEGILALGQALMTIRKHWLRGLAVAGIFTLLLFSLGVTPAFFASFFLLFLLMRFSNRVAIGLALLCLLSCPILVIFNSKVWAERLAIWTFCLLLIGVILQFADLYVGDKQQISD